jgi:hypothetical protein
MTVNDGLRGIWMRSSLTPALLIYSDLNQCSNFPDRFEFEAIQSGQRADYLRASVITGVNLAKIEALAAEVA